MFSDPSGLYIESLWDAFVIVVDSAIYGYDVLHGAPEWQLNLDRAALSLDTMALLVPIVPGGSGRALAFAGVATRGASKVATNTLRGERIAFVGSRVALSTAGSGRFGTHTFTNTGPVPNGGGPHNQVIGSRIKAIANQHPDWTHVGGGGSGVSEGRIYTPLGKKPFRRADITFKKANGQMYYEQVGKKTKGNPVPREVEAMDDIEQATGVRPVFTPYN